MAQGPALKGCGVSWRRPSGRSLRQGSPAASSLGSPLQATHRWRGFSDLFHGQTRQPPALGSGRWADEDFEIQLGVAVLANTADGAGASAVPRGESQESIEPAVGLTAAATQRTRLGEQSPEVELASQPHRRGLQMGAPRHREVSTCSLHERR
jgi:hypothetical protein